MARPIEKRENIERAVVQVVSQKGLSATTIQDIASAADVSPGLLYRYWQGRDDLAQQVYQTHYRRLIDQFAARIAADQPSAAGVGFWPTLRAIVSEFLRFADKEPTVLRFLMLSQHELASGTPPERGLRGLLLRLIDAGQQDGSIRPIPRELALQFLLGIGMQPVIGIFYEDLPGPASQHADAIIDALRRTLGPDQPSADESNSPASSSGTSNAGKEQ